MRHLCNFDMRLNNILIFHLLRICHDHSIYIKFTYLIRIILNIFLNFVENKQQFIKSNYTFKRKIIQFTCYIDRKRFSSYRYNNLKI